jgi:nucleoside phosphorylase
MKLLLCLNRLSDFEVFLNHLEAVSNSKIVPERNSDSANFLFSIHYLQHEIDICETGFGIAQTSYKITKAISQKKYHLALKAGFCNSYKAALEIGNIVNVIKDKAGDSGIQTEDSFQDLYDLQLSNKESFPHFKGAFINMNNSYMNIFLDFKKVVAVTVNNYANKNSFQLKKEKYLADIETMDGLGFVYACMYERQPFYQINCVERNLETDTTNFDLAKEKLNLTLIDILQKI